jgi:hypothetical protein
VKQLNDAKHSFSTTKVCYKSICASLAIEKINYRVNTTTLSAQYDLGPTAHLQGMRSFKKKFWHWNILDWKRHFCWPTVCCMANTLQICSTWQKRTGYNKAATRPVWGERVYTTAWKNSLHEITFPSNK